MKTVKFKREYLGDKYRLVITDETYDEVITSEYVPLNQKALVEKDGIVFGIPPEGDDTLFITWDSLVNFIENAKSLYTQSQSKNSGDTAVKTDGV